MTIPKIVITGPESTGKSTLAEQLANYYGTVYIPEYARTYVEKLGRPYVFEDLENIAKRQVEDIASFEPLANGLLFLDTYLIITKVWFDVVYQKCPDWVVEAIKSSKIDLFLLCNTDLPWIPDTIRENGGERREQLFQLYQKELDYFGFKYQIVSGKGAARLHHAVSSIEGLLGKENR